MTRVNNAKTSNCKIYDRIENGKLKACGKSANEKLIFLDGSIEPVCPKCFYEQVTDEASAVVGFVLADGWRVDFDVQSNKYMK